MKRSDRLERRRSGRPAARHQALPFAPDHTDRDDVNAPAQTRAIAPYGNGDPGYGLVAEAAACPLLPEERKESRGVNLLLSCGAQVSSRDRSTVHRAADRSVRRRLVHSVDRHHLVTRPLASEDRHIGGAHPKRPSEQPAHGVVRAAVERRRDHPDDEHSLTQPNQRVGSRPRLNANGDRGAREPRDHRRHVAIQGVAARFGLRSPWRCLGR